jgi:hypothetical protein
MAFEMLKMSLTAVSRKIWTGKKKWIEPGSATSVRKPTPKTINVPVLIRNITEKTMAKKKKPQILNASFNSDFEYDSEGKFCTYVNLSTEVKMENCPSVGAEKFVVAQKFKEALEKFVKDYNEENK